MRQAYKDVIELAFFPAFRSFESVLPADRLYACLRPYHQMRAILNKSFKKDRSMALPDFLGRLKTKQTVMEQRRAFYLNQIVDYFPDRLAGPKWKGRCRIEGLGHLQAAQQQRRPVVLGFCHFGAYILLRAWLRAAGFPAIILLSGKSTRRTRMRRLMDHYALWPEIPPVLYQDGWSEAIEHLRAGHPLLLALDVQRGKQIDIPFCEGWTFQMASGAVRLAIHNQAELIPCSLTDEGGWRYRLRLGKPVPREYLTSEKDWLRAGKHLLDEMLPDFYAHPEQCLPSFVRSLKPNTTVPTLTPCVPAS